MRQIITYLVLVAAWLSVMAAEPYCNVTTYGYREGVPASTGSRAIQDHNGVIWISTWNGLYRYDGYEFRPIRPEAGNEVGRYSSRFRDIKTGPDGKMWCRIDENIVLFDVDTYRYEDLQSRIEKHLGEKVKIDNAIRETTEGDIALSTLDGRHLLFDARKLKEGTDPIKALRVMQKDHPIDLKTAGFHKASVPPSFDRKDVAFSTQDNKGNIWIITKEGRILTGQTPEGAFKEMTKIDTDGSAIKFSCEDNQGNVWMMSRGGIHKIALGSSPLTYLTAPGSPNELSQLRASMIDSKGRIWMSWSDSEYVTVSSGLESAPLYLGADGQLGVSPVKFGVPVYCMAEGDNGDVWLGSKPEGLFRRGVTRLDARGAFKAPFHCYALSLQCERLIGQNLLSDSVQNRGWVFLCCIKETNLPTG